MEKKELQIDTKNLNEIVIPGNNITTVNNNEEGYVNEGFKNSNEELIRKMQENKPSTSKDINDNTEDTFFISPKGYINEAYDDILLTDSTENENVTDNTVNLSNGTESQTQNNSTVDDYKLEDNSKITINLEKSEKKWEVNLIGWDRTRTTMFLITFFAFDTWAAIFYCMKNNIIDNILNK